MSSRIQNVAMVLWVAACPAFAADSLHDIYLKALRNDADFASASASNEASREEGAKGRAGLMPTISISGTQTNNQTEQRSLSFLGMRTQKYDYTSSYYGINMRQPLYRPYIWAGYLQGQARVSYGEAVLASAKQELILRAAGAYLDVLLAGENVALTRAQKATLTEQVALAKAQFRKGEGTKTDINDAQARYDMTVAQELEALNALENNKRAPGAHHRRIASPAPRACRQQPAATEPGAQRRQTVGGLGLAVQPEHRGTALRCRDNLPGCGACQCRPQADRGPDRQPQQERQRKQCLNQ
jgi:hypothetical protein